MKLHRVHSHLSRALALFLGILLFVSFTASAYAAGYEQAPDSLDALLSRLNAGYGTDFHVITPEEAMAHYGIQLTNVRQTPMTRQELWEIESYLRHFAVVELPKIERKTEEALAISASLKKAQMASDKPAIPNARLSIQPKQLTVRLQA